mmetsp:Transcript_1201/g.2299  ORF Transcript_1201/g.2299 Transcript_1201/m.2299 type:complete len:584 (-) Transcript_1201:177-1928(-)
MGNDHARVCWGSSIPPTASEERQRISRDDSPICVSEYPAQPSLKGQSPATLLQEPLETRPGGSRRFELRPNHHSEGVIHEWGHRDTPVEIDKVYEMRQLIGQGTTSKVFLAVRRADGMPFACKVIDKCSLSIDPRQRQRVLNQLRKEIQILQLLDHPNIIHYEDMVETSSKIYCVLEYLEGGELYDYLLHYGPMPPAQASSMLRGVVEAVQHMHARGVVHRDIKAENLMLVRKPSNEEGAVEVKLIDFGFSTLLVMAQTQSFLGTAGYIAPEIRQERCYYKGVDVWAVGVLTYLVLCCRMPFDRDLSSLPKCGKHVRERFALEFPEPIWHSEAELGHNAQSVRSLLRGMLDVEPSTRLNAHQCLIHPFVTGELFGVPQARARAPRAAVGVGIGLGVRVSKENLVGLGAGAETGVLQVPNAFPSSKGGASGSSSSDVESSQLASPPPWSPPPLSSSQEPNKQQAHGGGGGSRSALSNLLADKKYGLPACISVPNLSRMKPSSSSPLPLNSNGSFGGGSYDDSDGSEYGGDGEYGGVSFDDAGDDDTYLDVTADGLSELKKPPSPQRKPKQQQRPSLGAGFPRTF